MIIEALQHLLTPAPRHIKQMGYVREAIAIEARYKRCAEAWRPHLEKCKELIVTQTEKMPAGSTVMVLGSGGLHDVPADTLLDRGFHISCVDIVHLPWVKKRHSELCFVTRDITGVIEPLYKAVKAGTRVHANPEWEFQKTPDLIISLNLLSQLGMKLVDYAEQHGENLGIQFHDNVLKAHIKWFTEQEANLLLISDISRDYYQSDRLVETVSSLPELEIGDPKETWLWNIAPTGEADKDISIRHKVGAWSF